MGSGYSEASRQVKKAAILPGDSADPLGGRGPAARAGDLNSNGPRRPGAPFAQLVDQTRRFMLNRLSLSGAET